MSGQGDLQIAFEAALAAQPETFLARYPRKLKLFVLVLLLAGLSFPLWGDAVFAVKLSAPTPPVEAKNDEPALLPEEKIEARAPTPLPEARKPETEEEKAAAARNDAEAAVSRLPEAPDPGLIEEARGGVLPRTGVDGRKPWIVYARPFDRGDPRPKIALIVGDMGLSRVATDAALRRLPPTVTLAFDAQGDAVEAWLKRARQDGYETLLSLPMEPLDFPRSDPGPNALLTSLPNADNIERLQDFLKRGAGYVGVTSLTGSRFTSDPEKLQPVLEEIGKRGLLLLDFRLAAQGVAADLARRLKIPSASCALTIDIDPAPRSIDSALAQLEKIALMEGRAVAMASPLPVTLERIELWAKGLAARGLVLAPVSAIVE